uniref:Uncharacterized protein n=1 Tax=Heterorhabditis bacteriophora TaxID=37862 RepID=A0A1I7WID1_HETBA
MDREAEHELSFESAPNTERVGYRARVKTKDRCSSEVEKQKWTELFPCAKGYVRLPRPLWSQGGLMGMKDSDDRLRRFNSRFGIQRSASGPRVLFASRKGAIDALNAARPGMSRSFELLLEMFAKIIVNDFSDFLDLGQKLVNGNTVPMNYLVVKVNFVYSIKFYVFAYYLITFSLGSSIWDDPESDDDYESDSETSNHSYDISDVDAETSDNGMTHEVRFLSFRKLEPITAFFIFISTRAYDFDMIWQLITMRYW